MHDLGLWIISTLAIPVYLIALTLCVTWLPKSMLKPFQQGFGVDALWGGFMLVPYLLGWLLHVPCWGVFLIQVAYLVTWCYYDEKRRGKPGTFSIRAYWIKRDGWLRYLVGWFCTAAIPLFFVIRLTEIVVYPVLIWAWGLPPLHARDYIQLSRHKWQGLVGADLLYCLYCEWMTGVWSLGSAQLQNIETMWCPLRFGHEGQCDKCKLFFPDIDDWARPETGMPGVEQFYKTHYDDRPMLERSAVCQRDGEEESSTSEPTPGDEKQ